MSTSASTPPSRESSKALSNAEVRALFVQLTEAWNRADATGYAALFSEDATYVTVDGTVYRGRGAIAGGHRAIFETFFKGSRLHGEVTELRWLRPDLAIAMRTGSVQTEGAPMPSAPESLQTFVVIKEGQAWKFAAFQNTLLARYAPDGQAGQP